MNWKKNLNPLDKVKPTKNILQQFIGQLHCSLKLRNKQWKLYLLSTSTLNGYWDGHEVESETHTKI